MVKKRKIWDKRFDEIKKFMKTHGRVPHFSEKKYKDLAVWCRTQRYEKDCLSAERVRLLNQIGFPWNLTDGRWEVHFNSLKKIKEKYGHWNLSAIKDIDEPDYYLPRWISNQVEQYHSKSKALTPERIAKLESLGFDWKMKEHKPRRLYKFKNR